MRTMMSSLMPACLGAWDEELGKEEWRGYNISSSKGGLEQGAGHSNTPPIILSVQLY